MKVSLFEIFLAQIVLYAAIWLIDEFIATYVMVVIPGISFTILMATLLAEFFERSRVPRKYFYIMGITVVTPLLVGFFFLWMYDWELDWMRGI